MSEDRSRTINISSSKCNQIVDITNNIDDCVSLSGVVSGMVYVFVPHTTAGITINENADPDVKSDILMGLDDMVSEDLPYDHSEGNSTAHIKASITGSSVSILIENGKLVLGTWQGIYFCEFDGPRKRKVFVKVISG